MYRRRTILAFRASLVGFELHAQNLASHALDVINGFGNFDATAFAGHRRGFGPQQPKPSRPIPGQLRQLLER